MSRDDERSPESWEDPDEDIYRPPDRPLPPPRPRRASRGEQETSQQRLRRPQPLPRQTRDLHGEYDPFTSYPRRVSRRDPHEEVETDPRYQRRSARPPQGSARTERDYEIDPRYRHSRPPYVREDEVPMPVRRTQSRPTQRRSTEQPGRRTRELPPPKRRSAWPWLFMGCLGGILLVALAAAIVIVTTLHMLPVGNLGGILTQNTYTKTDQQTVTMTNITQVQVQNQVGNISMQVDTGNTNVITVASVKKVRTGSQDAANQEFSRIQVQAGPGTTSTGALLVKATLPNQGGSPNTNDVVDLTITLPLSAISTASSAPLSFDITTSVGNITADGLSGFQSIKDDTGNITVNHAKLTAGSCIQTGHGNVAFNGALDTTTGVNFDPCDSTQKPDPNPHPWYKIHSEVGNIDLTLPAPTPATNVVLNASTLTGKITSDFDVPVQQNTDGSADSNGPLLANATPTPTALLLLDVSIGDIHLHKFNS